MRTNKQLIISYVHDIKHVELTTPIESTQSALKRILAYKCRNLYHSRVTRAYIHMLDYNINTQQHYMATTSYQPLCNYQNRDTLSLANQYQGLM